MTAEADNLSVVYRYELPLHFESSPWGGNNTKGRLGVGTANSHCV